MARLPFLNRLKRNERGVTLVEMAIVAPVIASLAFGSMEIATLVMRQTEIQEVAAELSSMAMADWPSDGDISTMKNIARASASLSSDEVSIVRKVKCGGSSEFYTGGSHCPEHVPEAHYLQIKLNDTYEPHWVKFGIGRPVHLEVLRSVEVS